MTFDRKQLLCNIAYVYNVNTHRGRTQSFIRSIQQAVDILEMHLNLIQMCEWVCE